MLVQAGPVYDTQCDDYEQFGNVVCATDSCVCFPEPAELASKLNRPWLSLCLFVSTGRWLATNREWLVCAEFRK